MPPPGPNPYASSQRSQGYQDFLHGEYPPNDSLAGIMREFLAEYKRSKKEQKAARESEYNNRFDTKILPFHNRPGESYNSWEHHASSVARNNRWPPMNTALSCLSVFRGSAARLTEGMKPQKDTYKTRDAFFEHMRKLFVSPAHKDMARTLFRARIQRAGEGVREFHGQLAVLWWDAYGAEKEPWRIKEDVPPPADRPNALDEPRGEHAEDLIEQYLKGLRDKSLLERLQIKEDTLGPITTYSEALSRVLSVQAQYHRLLQNEKHQQACDAAHKIPNFDVLKMQSPVGHVTKKSVEDDGGLNALSQPAKTGDKKATQAKGGKQYCSRHGWCGHNSANCRSQNPPKPGANNKQVNSLGSGAAQGQPDARECNHCGRKGHIAMYCPARTLKHLSPGEEEQAQEPAPQSQEEVLAAHGYDPDDYYINEDGEAVEKSIEGADTPAFMGCNNYNEGFLGN